MCTRSSRTRPTESQREQKSWQTRSILLDIADSCYSPKCVEVEFCELRLLGILRSSDSRSCMKCLQAHDISACAPARAGASLNITGAWPCLHKTLSGAGRWNRANFALTEF